MFPRYPRTDRQGFFKSTECLGKIRDGKAPVVVVSVFSQAWRRVSGCQLLRSGLCGLEGGGARFPASRSHLRLGPE